MLSALDLKKIGDAVGLIFSHLNKKLRISQYPIKRALEFVEAISKDLNDQLVKILEEKRLMYLSFEEFMDVYQDVCETLEIWDENVKEFITISRELTRKRGDKFIRKFVWLNLAIKVCAAHGKLKERLEFIYSFRKQHEQLYCVFAKALGSGDTFSSNSHALEDISLAYERVKHVEALNLTNDGTDAWVVAEKAYNEKVSRVENEIIINLRDKLDVVNSTKDMLRVFSKFK